jgi:hypothetical protein
LFLAIQTILAMQVKTYSNGRRVGAAIAITGLVFTVSVDAFFAYGVDDMFGRMVEAEEDWESPHVVGNPANVAGPWIPHSGGFPHR